MTHETDNIDSQPVLNPKSGHTRTNGDPGMYKRVLEALIVAATIALVVAVWNVTQTVTLLQASQDAQRRDLDRLERRSDMLEGKIARGEFDALDKQ